MFESSFIWKGKLYFVTDVGKIWVVVQDADEEWIVEEVFDLSTH